jgi:hypothetical protein
LSPEKENLQMRSSGGLSRATATDLVLVILFSVAIFGYAHLQTFTNPYIINDDVRQQVFWMQQWLDPEIFQGDLLSDYASHYVTWGVKGIYRLAALGLNPVDFSRVLPGILFAFLGGCLFKIGEVLGGRPLAWMAAAVFWLMPFFLYNMAGGLARAFAAPLIAFFWLCWLKERPWGMGLALLLQALFIPYIFVPALAAVMMASVAGRVSRGNLPPFPRRPGHFAFLAAAICLVLLMDHQFTAAGFGPLVSGADMANRPEFTAHGRYPILPTPSIFWELISPWEFIAPIREGGLVGGVIGVPLLIGLALFGACKVDWRALKPKLGPAGYLGLASLLVYLLARGFLLKLFVPDRYLIYSLNLFYCIFLARCWNAALRVANWPRMLAVLMVFVAVGLSGLRLKNIGLYDYSATRPLCEALAQTPKDALIAGQPNLMDAVPTFARRRAFATYKLAHPWAKGYWQRLKPRLEELFAAYYATDPEVVKNFCQRHHIDFLVVDNRHFAPDFLAGGWFYFPFEQPARLGKPKPQLVEQLWCPFFAPFDEQIRFQAQGGQQRFAVLDPKVFPRRQLDEHLWLLDMRSYQTPAPHDQLPERAR